MHRHPPSRHAHDGLRIAWHLSLCLAIIPAADFACAQDSRFKLRPLEYNHDGLVVDLGVGLWAYPIPVDHDGDGDLDLLVACPDKPSNGVYFFENPTQDPKETRPVFKPAVRVGAASHSMLLSRRGDQEVVLKPGFEYQRDPGTGNFDFSKPIRIDVDRQPFSRRAGRTRANMWRYVDFDGDGDHDIACGVGHWDDLGWDHAYDRRGSWRNGPLHGHVYIVENRGSDETPDYADKGERLKSASGDIDVYGWPCPNFADFDGDGDLDLLCGEFLDGFTFFRNIGNQQSPVYADGVRVTDPSGNPVRMDLQMITPTSIDWDQDGDFDLIVGDEDGRVAWVENTGAFQNGTPIFLSPVYFQQLADTLKFGALATPYVIDWDRDGDDDILCGNTAGQIGWFENLGEGKNGLPKWSAPSLLTIREQDHEQPFRIMAGPRGSIQGPCEAKWGYTTFSAADWDGDGELDIIYNSILGKLGVLRGSAKGLIPTVYDRGSMEPPPAWHWDQAPRSDTLTQWRTTPVVVDYDDDGQLDLVLLDQQGYLTLRPAGKAAIRHFVDMAGNPIRLNSGTAGRSGRVKLAVVDWDGDGRLDLLTNSENATWHRNVANNDGKTVLITMGNLATRNVAGHTSSPAISDFNRDGKPDLVVGAENGRIYHAWHDDCLAPTNDDDAIAASVAPPRFPGLIKEESIFEKAPFKQCHASTVCETSRGLVAAWFGGVKEGDPGVCIWSSYHDGLKWNGPTKVADGVQHASLRYPCWNPVLFQPPGDAPTLLFFKVGPKPDRWWGEMLVSYDRGRTFRDRRRLPSTIDGPVRCKPLLIHDKKRLLCGSSTESDGWRVHFESVALIDGVPSGTWERVDSVNHGDSIEAIQPTILTRRDGTLRALVRTQNGFVASSDSSDSGKTWTPLAPTALPNPNSGIDGVTLRDGRQLLVYNPSGSRANGWGPRGKLHLAISEDATNWVDVAILEATEKAEYSYPAIIQSADGRVHITYTHKREHIKHLIIDPDLLRPLNQPRPTKSDDESR